MEQSFPPRHLQPGHGVKTSELSGGPPDVFGRPITPREPRGTRNTTYDPLHTQATAGQIIFGGVTPRAEGLTGSARGRGACAPILQPSSRVVSSEHAGNAGRQASVAAAPSFLDDVMPHRAPPNYKYGHTEPSMPSMDYVQSGLSKVATDVRDLQADTHRGNGVPANVFNQDVQPSTTLLEHPVFKGAAGMPSDAKLAQLHPGEPGMRDMTQKNSIGVADEEVIARRAALLTPAGYNKVPGTKHGAGQTGVIDSTTEEVYTYPWEPARDVPPTRPAPPKEYAHPGACPAERGRFRGTKKVESHCAGTSMSELPGGILNQDNFPEPPPKRWGDATFESRMRAAIEPVKHKGPFVKGSSEGQRPSLAPNFYAKGSTPRVGVNLK